jgi:DNA repair protein Crb2 Tudor domain
MGMPLHSAWVLAFVLLAGGVSAREAGDRVLARWGADGMWYPARVSAVQGGNISVAYDDGDVAVLDATGVRAIYWTQGTRLQCNWKNQGVYYGGEVAAMEGETITFHYDDGYSETITISRCRSLPDVE